jgi:hypothetical protein
MKELIKEKNRAEPVKEKQDEIKELRDLIGY